MRFVVRQAARRDLDDIFGWISKDSLRAARAVVERILLRVNRLATRGLASMGRPGLVEGTRELLEPPYIIVYRVDVTANEIVVHRSWREEAGRMMRKSSDRRSKGEIGRVRIVEDFLPSPEQLVLREDDVKVTLSLSQRSVDFFKRAAAKETEGAVPAHDQGVGGCLCGAGWAVISYAVGGLYIIRIEHTRSWGFLCG